MRQGKRVRSPSAGTTAKRIGLIWLLLCVYCLAAIAVAWPIDGKQLTVFVVLFVMIGYNIDRRVARTSEPNAPAVRAGDELAQGSVPGPT
jgi:hypothetical protein